MLLVTVEQVSHREVIQLQSYLTYDTSLSPSERELNLVVRLLLKIPVNVHRTVFAVRSYIRVYLLLIEVSHRCYLTGRTHQCILREEIARLCTQLTAHYLLIQSGITRYPHMRYVCLWSLHYAHLKVDAVAYHVHLHGVELIEQVTIIPICVAYGIFILSQSFLQQSLVIHVTLVHTEDFRQLIRIIHGITSPCYVAQIIFLTLKQAEIYVHMLLVTSRYHAVSEQHGIAIATLVIPC